MPPIVGLFGGTFDPPHIGHLILAAEAYSQLGLSRLLWILTPDPPHKTDQLITPIQHRLTMVRLALAKDSVFELSTVDLDRPGPHYALDTVDILARQFPGTRLVYVMGGDSLRDLPTWHRPVDFVSRIDHLAVMRRIGDNIDLPDLENKIPGLTAKTCFVDAPLVDIAAHEIRMRVAQGRPYRYFLTPPVYKYIGSHHLYQPSPTTPGN